MVKSTLVGNCNCPMKPKQQCCAFPHRVLNAVVAIGNAPITKAAIGNIMTGISDVRSNWNNSRFISSFISYSEGRIKGELIEQLHKIMC